MTPLNRLVVEGFLDAVRCAEHRGPELRFGSGYISGAEKLSQKIEHCAGPACGTELRMRRYTLIVGGKKKKYCLSCASKILAFREAERAAQSGGERSNVVQFPSNLKGGDVSDARQGKSAQESPTTPQV